MKKILKYVYQWITSSDFRFKQRELRRLGRMPRYRPAYTRITGSHIHMTDAASFVYMYGEIFDQQAMTAAYRGLPFGTKLKVTNLENGKSVVVTINDRMARRNKNIIDVTRRAAQELGFEEQGRTRVSVEPLP